MKMNTKMNPKYCSTCKHSKYVDKGDRRKLYCEQREAFYLNPYLDVKSTNAETCLEYDPERIRDCLTKSKGGYLNDLSKCGLLPRDAQEGVLCDNPPRV